MTKAVQIHLIIVCLSEKCFGLTTDLRAIPKIDQSGSEPISQSISQSLLSLVPSSVGQSVGQSKLQQTQPMYFFADAISKSLSEAQYTGIPPPCV